MSIDGSRLLMGIHIVGNAADLANCVNPSRVYCCGLWGTPGLDHIYQPGVLNVSFVSATTHGFYSDIQNEAQRHGLSMRTGGHAHAVEFAITDNSEAENMMAQSPRLMKTGGSFFQRSTTRRLMTIYFSLRKKCVFSMSKTKTKSRLNLREKRFHFII